MFAVKVEGSSYCYALRFAGFFCKSVHVYRVVSLACGVLLRGGTPEETKMVVMAALVGVAVVFIGLALISAALNLLGKRDAARSSH